MCLHWYPPSQTNVTTYGNNFLLTGQHPPLSHSGTAAPTRVPSLPGHTRTLTHKRPTSRRIKDDPTTFIPTHDPDTRTQTRHGTGTHSHSQSQQYISPTSPLPYRSELRVCGLRGVAVKGVEPRNCQRRYISRRHTPSAWEAGSGFDPLCGHIGPLFFVLFAPFSSVFLLGSPFFLPPFISSLHGASFSSGEWDGKKGHSG